MIPAEFAQVFYEVCDRLEGYVIDKEVYEERTDPEAREAIRRARWLLAHTAKPLNELKA